MLCIHCGDQVCIRHEREGVIHKHGRYVCRQKQDGQDTVAEVRDVAAERRLLLAASIRQPETEPDAIKRSRRKLRDDDYDPYL